MAAITSTPAIDAVITWVSGDDQVLAAKRQACLSGVTAHPEASRSTRFNSIGEIEYCIASIIRFAPFVRTLFVVTDAQVPEVLERGLGRNAPWAHKVRIVDHREIFSGFERYLPTFSSCPIETMLYRIPGLSEHFVSFNDDFFLMRAVNASDFFVDGKPVLRGGWRPQQWELQAIQLLNLGHWNLVDLEKPTFRRAQAKAASLLGWKFRYFHSEHAPRPLRRSTFERLFERQPDWLRQNVSHRLRHVSQFFAPGLANHLEILEKTAVVTRELALLYAEPAEIPGARLKRALSSARQDGRILFGCLQSLDEASDETRQFVISWLDSVVGRLPP